MLIMSGVNPDQPAMLKHSKKLKELCLKNGKVDGRKMRSKKVKNILLTKAVKDLVIARLEVLPDDCRISIG